MRDHARHDTPRSTEAYFFPLTRHSEETELYTSLRSDYERQEEKCHQTIPRPSLLETLSALDLTPAEGPSQSNSDHAFPHDDHILVDSMTRGHHPYPVPQSSEEKTKSLDWFPSTSEEKKKSLVEQRGYEEANLPTLQTSDEESDSADEFGNSSTEEEDSTDKEETKMDKHLRQLHHSATVHTLRKISQLKKNYE